MRFPLADWIDSHPDCRHNLGGSGMRGSIAHPRPTAREIRAATARELESELATRLHVDPRRIFLTHGATEANSWVVFYRAHERSGTTPRGRVELPEYPPLVDDLRLAGFRLVHAPTPCDLAVISRPRNPEGTLWPQAQLDAWTAGARAVLLDETFREFSGVPSQARRGRRGVWATGTFTKFYAADDIRVGYVIAPPEEVASFRRFHGLVTDELPPFSVASALKILRAGDRFTDPVRRLFESNRAAWATRFPLGGSLAAPVWFDRVPDGDRLARTCLRASVLVCPGSFFGEPKGVRLTLTRRSFPRDLDAYLKVRNRAVRPRSP